MKKNRKVLLLSLLACSILVGCDETTQVQEGSKPVGTVQDSGAQLDTALTKQKLYENLKASSGGSEAVSQLIKLLSKDVYKDLLAGNDFQATGDSFDVRTYRTQAAFISEIEKKFQDIVDGTSYRDDDGEFDGQAYKEYVTDSLDYEVTQEASKYIKDADLAAKLQYNYDKYIEESIIPSILENYIYADYVTGSSKYKSQFATQYVTKLEVLKIPHDTSKLNSAWNEAFVRDIKAVTAGKNSAAGYLFAQDYDYSFVTFNSKDNMILVNATNAEVSYEEYENTAAIDALIEKMYEPDATTHNVKRAEYAEAAAVAATLTPIVEEKIDATSKANQEFYETVEKILIARSLWAIDREIALARNYDYKTPLYDALTETEKTEASGFASTYSSSNTKPLREVSKEKRISTQQTSYYTEPKYYAKSEISNVVPSSFSSLRGTSAKDLLINLSMPNEAGEGGFGDGRFLLPKKDSLTDPVYLDTDSNNYYVCEVHEWYGYYKKENLYTTRGEYYSLSNYQIDAYQKGSFKEYAATGTGGKYEVSKEVSYSTTTAAEFESIIGLVQKAAEKVLTSSMKKEAMIELFSKYELEINDQDIYDYAKSQYPDFFSED